MRCEEVGHPLSLRNRTSEESVVRCDNNSQSVESRKIVRDMQEVFFCYLSGAEDCTTCFTLDR